MKTTAADRELLETLQEGLRRLGLTFPYLVGLIAKIELRLDRRVATTGIFASGRLLMNPDFARALSPQDLIFVLAHELYHLTLRSHERGEGTDPLAFNHAHDYIINDLLREELQLDAIPAGGPDWPGARTLSAERLLGEMQRNPDLRPSASWDQLMGGDSGEGAEGNAAGEPGEGSEARPAGDVLDSALERKWFPGTDARAQEARTREVQEQAARAMSLQALMDSMRDRGKGNDPGAGQDSVAALRGWYRPPWELALQRWLESVAPSDRSYARPSRRGADRTDVVLPGRKREGWTLHIVLDTSGSMVDEVPRALGVIADFCEAVGVEQVHLIQCDTAVGRDEILAPAELTDWQVSGFGGSDLTPALLRLAEDPEVSAAVVLTDGEIDYPEQAVPYGVLWVLPAWKDPRDFTPRYGKVIAMTHG